MNKCAGRSSTSRSVRAVEFAGYPEFDRMHDALRMQVSPGPIS